MMGSRAERVNAARRVLLSRPIAPGDAMRTIVEWTQAVEDAGAKAG